MKRAARGALLGLIGLLAAEPARACSCMRDSLGERLDRADVVALVRVRSASVNPAWIEQLARDEHDFGIQPVLATFDVIESFKGDIAEVEHLMSGHGGGDCGLELTPGFDLIVAGTPDHETLYVGYCSGSRELGVYSIVPNARPRPTPHAAYLDAVRDYVIRGQPFHECFDLVAQVGPPPSPEEWESSKARCADYRKQFESRD